MSIGRRLDRLESRTVQTDIDHYVRLVAVGKTDDDVIGVDVGRTKVRREPGETLDELIARARRQSLQETPEVGLPRLVSCIYDEDRF